jgi:hypothetical protein
VLRSAVAACSCACAWRCSYELHAQPHIAMFAGLVLNLMLSNSEECKGSKLSMCFRNAHAAEASCRHAVVRGSMLVASTASTSVQLVLCN